MATGSCEESLLMEGIPDHHEASSFTRGAHGWSRRLRHPPTRNLPPKAVGDGDMQLPRRRERREVPAGSATGVSEARPHPHRGKKTPTLRDDAVRLMREGPVSMTVRRSGPGRRETSCPLVTPYGAQDSVGHPPRESERASQEHTRCGHTQFFDWVADIGRMHRASFAPAGRKAWWRS